MTVTTLETERLYLRQWQPSDLAIFANMNADPEVMQYFPKLLSATVSDVIANKCQQLITDNGWGFWAVSIKQSHTFIGFVGLNETHADMPCAPCVEIAWRLRKEFWGQGYATEAAHASLKFGFETLALADIVAFTSTINQRSQQLMARIGMTNTQDNFYHPALSCTHRLAEQVLYKINREQWLKETGKTGTD